MRTTYVVETWKLSLDQKNERLRFVHVTTSKNFTLMSKLTSKIFTRDYVDESWKSIFRSNGSFHYICGFHQIFSQPYQYRVNPFKWRKDENVNRVICVSVLVHRMGCVTWFRSRLLQTVLESTLTVMRTGQCACLWHLVHVGSTWDTWHIIWHRHWTYGHAYEGACF